jgi:hypothetical protein
LRGIALGRKAWLFAGSDRGGQRAAVMFSLITTALCRMRHRAVYAERRTMPSDAVLGGRERSGHASGVIFRSSVARHSQRRSKRVKERKKLVVRSEPSGCFAFVRAELGQRSFLQSEMGVQIDLGCLD